MQLFMPVGLVLQQPWDAAGGKVKHHYLGSYRGSLVQVIKCQVNAKKFDDGMQGVLELAEGVCLQAST